MQTRASMNYFHSSRKNLIYFLKWKLIMEMRFITQSPNLHAYSCFSFMYNQTVMQYDSSKLGEALCPVSSSLSLRVHKLHVRVSFSDTFLRWLPPFCIRMLSLSAEKKRSLLYLTGQWLRVNFILYYITDHCLARLRLFI